VPPFLIAQRFVAVSVSEEPEVVLDLTVKSLQLLITVRSEVRALALNVAVGRGRGVVKVRAVVASP
jgi:hypothetical protein